MPKRTGNKYYAIIDAAVNIIAEHGYHQAQVSKIAREAGVADGTIYLYFKNKDDLLISLFQVKLGLFVERVTFSLSTMVSPTKKLYHVIRSHFDFLEQDPSLAIVTQLELRQPNPEIRKAIGRILKPYLRMIDGIVEEGIQSGIFRHDLDVRLTRKMIFGTLDEIVTSWIMDQRKYRLHDMVETTQDLFMNGMTCKGADQ